MNLILRLLQFSNNSLFNHNILSLCSAYAVLLGISEHTLTEALGNVVDSSTTRTEPRHGLNHDKF